MARVVAYVYTGGQPEHAHLTHTHLPLFSIHASCPLSPPSIFIVHSLSLSPLTHPPPPSLRTHVIYVRLGYRYTTHILTHSHTHTHTCPFLLVAFSPGSTAGLTEQASRHMHSSGTRVAQHSSTGTKKPRDWTGRVQVCARASGASLSLFTPACVYRREARARAFESSSRARASSVAASERATERHTSIAAQQRDRYTHARAHTRIYIYILTREKENCYVVLISSTSRAEDQDALQWRAQGVQLLFVEERKDREI